MPSAERQTSACAGPVLDRLTRLFTRRKLSEWAFGKYLNVCHPDLVDAAEWGHDPAKLRQTQVEVAA